MRGQAGTEIDRGSTQVMVPEVEGEESWGESTHLRTEIDWSLTGLFDPMLCILQSSSDFIPPVDLYETETEVVLNAHLPGMHPEDFLVEVTGEILYLTGVLQPRVPEQATRVHRVEGSGGRFDLRFHLPVPVKDDGVRATYRNGILEVRMPLGAKP